MPNVQPLTLLETMVHEIPRGRWRDDASEKVVLSEAVTPLTPQTDRFIREGMLQPALADGREIIDSGEGDLVPKLVKEVLQDSSLLPVHSREIAQHLHESQSGGASAGVFMASLATEVGKNRFVILKAEHQEGVRLRQSGEGGHVAFEVEHISELIVGQNSRVYKIAMLWIDDNDALVGLMVDKQNGVAYADYFLLEFLGMKLAHQAEIMTRDFLKGATDYIRSTAMSAEKRTRYATALMAYMESPNNRIVPAQFISDYIDQDDRDLFSNALPSHAGSSFRKDITLVKSQIGGLRFVMADGDVSISATTQAMEDGTVQIEPDAPGGPQVVIKGIPDSIDLKKPPK